MSVSVEIEMLEGIDLEGSPPCQCIWRVIDTNAQTPCGNTSIARIYLAHDECGYEGTRFICASCLTQIKAGYGWCRGCGKSDVIFTWKEI